MSQSFDIIIIGAGTAGMACAISAAEKGLNVGVIEKSDRIGGALHWSGGHMSAGGTELQKRNNIQDSPEQHYADILRISQGTGDLELIRKAVQEAPSTIDYLDENGFDFAPEAPRIIYGHVAYNIARTHYGQRKAMSIYHTLLPLWTKQVELGKIHCFLNHEMIGLDQYENRYTSVIASSIQGESTFSAGNIVVTSGGYGSNPSYFAKKHPGIPLISSAYPMSTADGHKIIENNGGRFRMADLHLPSLGGMEVPQGSGRCDFNTAWAMVLTSVYRKPRDIYVNALGKRFMNEEEECADKRERLVVQQPGQYFYVIFDEHALSSKDENGNHNPIIINWSNDEIRQESLKEVSIWQAETLKELAMKINVPEEQFSKTLTDYNHSVQADKEDEYKRTYLDFGVSKAPFYAVKVCASVLVTFGGIETNGNLEVIDQNGQVMSGLYAAGEILGLGALSGRSFCSGMAITPALSFGRILGRKLANLEGG